MDGKKASSGFSFIQVCLLKNSCISYNGWKEGIEWAVKEKVWDDVNFDNLFTTIKDTETESTTEQATE